MQLDKEKFEKDMIAFPLGKINDALIYYEQMTLKGYTFEDTREYLKLKHDEYAAARRKQKEVMDILSKNCPECDSIMVLLEVNTTPSTMTGDPKDKSVWYCRNCGESEYMQRSLATIYKELGGK